ncbi:MAG: recombination-associated protein RdgC [Alphaproteobacteria bacterium]|nr:recombination-associated protein RdgC [Alphaproteobacteria bacterium]
MGIMSGAMSVRRFRVVGELPEGWRELFRDRLQELAFKTPPHEVGKEEIEGWVEVHNLLDADFENYNRWLYNEFVLIALRVDKKRLPAKLFAATLEKRCEAWKKEKEVERVPASIRTELKEALELEWLKQTLPTVAVTEAAWNVNEEWLVLHGMSDAVSDRFRKRFFRTFGLRLVPWSPLDWVRTTDTVEGLINKAPSLMASPEDLGELR